MQTIVDSPIFDKLDQRAAAIVAAGLIVRIDECGGSVANDQGYIYRVDLDLGGRPNCGCRYFQYHGDCKHLYAIRMARNAGMITVNVGQWNEKLRSVRHLLAEVAS